MDEPWKPSDRTASAQQLAELYKGLETRSLTIAQAVKMMRKVSRMKQAEFAKHRGISTYALKQIEGGKGSPSVERLNKVASVFGLHVGFVAKRRREG